MNYLSLSSARSVVVLGMVPIIQAWYEAVPWPMSWASNHGFTFFRLHRWQLGSGYRPSKFARTPPALRLDAKRCRGLAADQGPCGKRAPWSARLAGVVSHPPGHALLAAAVRKERGEGASEGRTDA